MYQRIRDLREDRDMTQKDVARYLHCSQQVYSNYELGQRDVPTEVLIALARLHHTTTDYLLGLSNEREGAEGEGRKYACPVCGSAVYAGGVRPVCAKCGVPMRG